jgi:hypothetical protein
MTPEQLEVVRVEFVEFCGQGMCIGGIGQGKAADALDAGKICKKGSDHAGDGDVPDGAPEADISIGFVVDSDGDVAHVAPERVLEERLSIPLRALCAGGG